MTPLRRVFSMGPRNPRITRPVGRKQISSHFFTVGWRDANILNKRAIWL